MLEIFSADAFSLMSLTTRINNLPFVPGQIGSSGIFDEEGVTTTKIAIESRDMVLGLVAPTPRGGPGETAPMDGRNLRIFAPSHFQRDDAIYADEVQNVRAFGTEDRTETIAERLDRKVRKHLIAMDATLEHQRAGAIKGIILDKNGNTVYNLFTEFGVAEPAEIDFLLGTSTTSLRQLTLQVQEAMEAALDGVPYTGIDAYVGKTFWAKLIDHDKVKETYLGWQAAAELRRGIPLDDSFNFGNITWHRYRTGAQATAANTGGAFIGDTKARFVARGVPELFKTFFAPADYEETVNTIGLPRYMKQFKMDNDKGRNLEVQTNPLSICTRPQTLLRATTSN